MHSVRIVAVALISVGAAACSGASIQGVQKGDADTQLGAVVGTQIRTADLTEEAKRNAAAAQRQALNSGENGKPVAWHNPGSGQFGKVIPGAAMKGDDSLVTGSIGAQRQPAKWIAPQFGKVIPGPIYWDQGIACRPYTHIMSINGEQRVALGSACRKPDGTWQAAN